MEPTVFIYSLHDPETGHLRYIGKASNPKKRLGAHIRDTKFENNHRSHWIDFLSRKGLKPLQFIVAEVPESNWPLWEMNFIKRAKLLGFDLVNGNEGGKGACTGNKIWVGRKHSFESRKRISEALTGREFSKKHRENLSSSKKGKPNLKLRGRKLPYEVRYKISESLKRKAAI